jgi:sarcosine oxidase subunit beta
LAAYEPTSGYADPVATTRALLAAAVAGGAELRTDTAVQGLRLSDSRVLGVETVAGPIAAPVVVLAAGCWNDRLAATAGLALAIRPSRSQWALFDQPVALAGRQLVLIDTVLGCYSRPAAGGQLLAGMGYAEIAQRVDPDDYAESNDAGFAEAVRQRIAQRLPVLADRPYLGGSAGLYDISPDTRAIIGAAPGIEGLYLAAGFSGTGFKKAPAVGLGLAELIITGRASSVDLHPFRYERFADGDADWGEEYTLPVEFGHRF